MKSDPKTCKHVKFEAYVATGRIVAEHELAMPDAVKPSYLVIDVRVRCAGCDQPVLFTGMTMGVAAVGPMVSVSQEEARLTGRIKAPEETMDRWPNDTITGGVKP